MLERRILQKTRLQCENCQIYLPWGKFLVRTCHIVQSPIPKQKQPWSHWKIAEPWKNARSSSWFVSGDWAGWWPPWSSSSSCCSDYQFWAVLCSIWDDEPSLLYGNFMVPIRPFSLIARTRPSYQELFIALPDAYDFRLIVPAGQWMFVTSLCNDYFQWRPYAYLPIKSTVPCTPLYLGLATV
jgi:hypothetical protein